MKLEDIKKIGIVGAGQMGRGISQVCATVGYEVLLVDVAEPPLTAAISKIRTGLQRAVERGSLTDHQAGEVLALVRPLGHLDRLRDVQVVIEAVPEDLTVKQELFAQLNRICAPQVALASNTSSISITKLGAASGRPDQGCRVLHHGGPHVGGAQLGGCAHQPGRHHRLHRAVGPGQGRCQAGRHDHQHRPQTG